MFFVLSTLQNYEVFQLIPSFFLYFAPTYSDVCPNRRQLVLAPLKICRLMVQITPKKDKSHPGSAQGFANVLVKFSPKALSISK